MTKEEVSQLQNGVYKLYTTKILYSISVVGSLHDGSKWFVCSHWTSRVCQGIFCGTDWDDIIKAEPILLDNKIMK